MYYQTYKWSNARKCKGFDSRFEKSYADELALRKRAGDIKDYQCQVKIPLIVNGYVVADYFCDFKVIHNDGTIEYVETKGRPGEVWKFKWKLLEAMTANDPDIKLTVVYQGKTWKPRLRKAIKGITF
jgi:hypothetical protein